MLYNEPSPLEVKVLSRRFGLPNSASIDTYLATDGYKAFQKALGMKPEEIIEEVKVSNLRGRGGAGFPTGMKWSFVPRTSPKPKYIVVNADESEPGTCKDRVLIENDPHQLIEGVLIAGLAVAAHAGYIYVRGEYRYLIEEVGGGVRNGKKLKAFIPGGSSCPVLTASEVEGATMDYDSMAARKSMLGSGGVIVMDEDTCMVKAALRIMRFYAHESCGWCIPCSEGTTWLRKILQRFHQGQGTANDINLIGDISKNMLGRTFCPLGDAAALPTISIVEKFRDEFENHLRGQACPYEAA